MKDPLSTEKVVGPPKPKSGYWYEWWLSECVLCARSRTYKERRYGPKPENPYHFEQFCCGDHFL